MKTIKIVLAMFLIATASVMAQKATMAPATKTTANKEKENTYFVQAPHTPEQCMNLLNEMKDKGDSYLSKFWFGCNSGDHTAYGILKGNSEDEVRKMLPKEEQENSKIEKVDKFTTAELMKMHKENK